MVPLGLDGDLDLYVCLGLHFVVSRRFWLKLEKVSNLKV